MTSTPDSMKGDVEVNDRAELKKQGVVPRRSTGASKRSKTSSTRGSRSLEQDPHGVEAFLPYQAERVPGRHGPDVKPGAALDVGIGQGRNAIWLAQQGWTVRESIRRSGRRGGTEGRARAGVKLTDIRRARRPVRVQEERLEFRRPQLRRRTRVSAARLRHLETRRHRRRRGLSQGRDEAGSHRRRGGVRHERTADAVQPLPDPALRRHRRARRLRPAAHARRALVCPEASRKLKAGVN